MGESRITAYTPSIGPKALWDWTVKSGELESDNSSVARAKGSVMLCGLAHLKFCCPDKAYAKYSEEAKSGAH